MTYATLMVHLELDHPNAGLLNIAGTLAQRFQAGVTGIAARQFTQVIYSEGYLPGDLIELDRAEIEQELKAAEAEFRTALQGQVATLDWRSTVTFSPVSSYLARQARSADLLITKTEAAGSVFDPSRHLNIGDVVMQIGRPVLVVPAAADALKLDRVMVAWKDTRETRRAIVDGLPFLEAAQQVSVVQIAPEEELDDVRSQLDEVVAWLARHGVTADSVASASNGNDAQRLEAIAREQGADLLVAGAYGHSRLREWALGGVTRDLLLKADRCTLVSH